MTRHFKINVPVDGEEYLSPDGRVTYYSAVGETSHNKADLKKRVAARVAQGLAILDNNLKTVIVTNDGHVLTVYHNGISWYYSIASKAHNWASGVGGSWESHKSTVESATRHADQAYGGVAWTSTL